MIEQAYVQAGDVTTPAVATLRARISQAIDATVAATALDRLKVWLQMPTDSTFFNGVLDKLCGERAKDLGERLSPGAGGSTSRGICRRRSRSLPSGRGSAPSCTATVP